MTLETISLPVITLRERVNTAASLVIPELSLLKAAFVEAAAGVFCLIIPKSKITYYQLLLTTGLEKNQMPIKSTYCLS